MYIKSLYLPFPLQRKKEKILEDIGTLRDKMKAMVQEASRKESAEAQLKEQVEKITKDVNRFVSHYAYQQDMQ